MELTQRIHKFKQTFPNSSDSKRIIVSILDGTSKIKSEKLTFENELSLDEI
ncbi:hypothetical protein [Nitrosopumilus sp.]|uniref:hypothetical protein n=1 Tax=Nitrosopumilus sp. TaxID=2024843 RepID=UPI00292E7BC6|nr:hypothetical protein [Nitrosopumilus sp.]